MKRLILLIAFFSPLFQVKSQSAKALTEVEKAFEKSCLESGIRTGFLAFVDSNAVDYSDKGMVNAKKTWTSYPDFAGVFSWSPSFAEMSLSGDWGYTTGNYEHRARTLNDSVEETGQYTTVWNKSANGDWKYLIDIGNLHPPASLEILTKEISTGKSSSGRLTNQKQLLDQENLFILSFQKNPDAAYQKYAGTKYILNLSGFPATTSSDSAVMLIKNIPGIIEYLPAGVTLSGGKDMAAVYGTFNIGEKKGNYLRIWRHEYGGWKIALEVIKI